MKSYKDSVLEREKGTLLRLRKERDRIQMKIEDLNNDFRNVNAELKAHTLRGISVVEMRSYRFQIENIHQQIKDLEVQLERMEERVELQLRIVVNASQEVAGLDKLKEKQLEEYNRLTAKEESETIEEFVSTRFVRERSLSQV